MKFLGVKWYWWALALLVPGGLLILAAAKAKSQNAPADVGSTSKAGRLGQLGLNTADLIDRAKAAAAALTSGLKDNPLAASILGVSPSLIAQGSPSDVAAAASKNDSIRKQIAALEAQLAQYQAGYARDHNGGQSPSQEQSIESSIVSQIQSLQAQLTA